jgi:hypothetical protein
VTGATASRPSGEPLVSVVMPCFNAGKHVAEAVASILTQTHRALELIVVDDGSTDGTAATLAAIDDPRLVILRNSGNSGIVETLNRGFAAARGEFIARMDADDVALPVRIEKQIRHLRAHPELAVVGTGVAYIDEDGRPLVSPRLPPRSANVIRWRLLAGNCIHHPTVVFRRSALVMPIYSAASPDAEDYALWLRLSRSVPLGNLPERLLLMRRHRASVSALHGTRQAASAAAALAGHVAECFGLSITEATARGLIDPAAWLLADTYGAPTPLATLRKLRAAFLAGVPGLSAVEAEAVRTDLAYFAAKCLRGGARALSAGRLGRGGALLLESAAFLATHPAAACRAFAEVRARVHPRRGDRLSAASATTESSR